MKKIIVILFLAFANALSAQAPNDCVNAITVCGNGIFSSNASGIGNTQEITNGCSGQEHNSIWLKINIVQSGTLGFHIRPVDPAITVDYDFWVFGANRGCGSLGSPIRCATTNPNLAGLATNYTGMYGTTTLTQVGPGANGNGYVRWIDVVAGQFYYIAIDRPVGDGGFELEWIGSSTSGSGAFAIPPTANDIVDYKTCSSNPAIGIFDLNSIKTLINSNTTDNTITFYTNLNNAVDGIFPMSNITSNSSNPQQIFARVTNNITKCFTITDLDLKVYPVPQINDITASDPQICSGDQVTLTITGTPDATVDYQVGSGPVQTVVLDSAGKYIFHETLTGTTTFNVVAARIMGPGNTIACSQTVTKSVTVNVISISSPTISTNSPICNGDVAKITITGAVNADVHYKIGSGSTLTFNLGATGTNTLSIPGLTSDTVITFVDITATVAPFCSIVLTDAPTILVKPLPVAVNLPAYAMCTDGVTPNTALFNLASKSLAIANNVATSIVTFYTTRPLAEAGVAGTELPSPYRNTSQNQTIYVRVEALNGCVVYTTLVLQAVPTPIANIPNQMKVCGSGGIGEFNLTLANAQITAGNTLPVTVTFHLTPQDADDNLRPITGNTAYNSMGRTVYARVSSATACYKVVALDLIVNEKPTIRTIMPYVVCDTDYDGYTDFNLNSLDVFVLHNYVASDHTITYYRQQSEAALPTNAIVGTSNFPNSVINGQTLWVRLENNTTKCFAIASFDIKVGSILQVNTNYTATECDTDGDGFARFNLLNNNTAILFNAVNTADYAVTYYPTVLDATNNTAVITLPQAYDVAVNTTRTLGVRVTTIATGCVAFTQLQLQAKALPNPSLAIGPIIHCDVVTPYDLKEVFNLTQFETTIRNGDGSLIITYHTTRSLAQTGNNAIVGPNAFLSPSTTVYVRVANSVTPGTACYVVLPLVLTVNPLPVIIADPYEICDSNASGYSDFNLIGRIPALLGPLQNASDFTVSFFTDNLYTNQITVNPYRNVNINNQIIYVRVTHNATGCFTGKPLQLSVKAGTRVEDPDPVVKCGEVGLNPGIATFDLTSLEAEVLDGQAAADFLITYHFSSIAATNGTAPIANPERYQNSTSPYFQTIYIRVKNIRSVTSCIAVTQVDLTVEGLIVPKIITDTAGSNTICVNYETGFVERPLTLYSMNIDPDYAYKWFLNGDEISGATASSYPITTAAPGLYELEITNTLSTAVCPSGRSAVFEVIQSGPAHIITATGSEPFSNDQKITVVVEGYGEYWFQLDDGQIVNNGGVFYNVASGSHTVTIYDKKTGKPSCAAVTTQPISLLDFPKFFTPNDDGYHDYWNISALSGQSKALIYIFDRYGKLIKQIRPNGPGWDGTYNGVPVGASDYWFLLIYEQGTELKEFRAHFSLKR